MLKSLRVLIASIFLCDAVLGKYFSIIGPQTAQPGTEYRAYLTTTAFDTGKNLQVSLWSGRNKVGQENIFLFRLVEREIIFKIPGGATEDFTLKAVLDGLDETFEKAIKIITKKVSVLIQTDKAIYKPGDTVQFRVLALDREMKPYQFKEMKIVIADGKKIPIPVRTAPLSDLGFYSSTLELGDEINLGKWGIHVKVDNEKTTRHNFQVEQFKLPQFNVFIEPDKKSFVGSKVRAQVSAKYPHGKFVQGKATVTATAFDPEIPDKILGQKSTKSFNNGDTKALVEFDLISDLKLGPSWREAKIKLEATFESSMTRKSESAETSVKAYKYPRHTFEMKGDKEFITQGQTYTLRVMVKDHEGDLVMGDSKQVKINIYKMFLNQWCEAKTTIIKTRFNITPLPSQTKNLEKGYSEFVIEVPDDAQALTIQPFYRQSRGVHKVLRVPTKTDENLELTVDSESLDESRPIKVRVDSTTGVERLHSVIIGRSGIVHKQAHVMNLAEEFEFTINASPSMRPVSNLIVYYIHPTGEVIFDQKTIRFKDLLPNKLKIGLSQAVVEPGSDVSLAVETGAESVVCLLAVDRRSSLLKDGNDITNQKVRDEINSIYFTNVFNEANTTNPYTLLGHSNAILLTNANDGEPDCNNVRGGFNDNGNVLTHGEYEKMLGDQQASDDLDSLNDLDKTWIFEQFTVNKQGRYNFNKKIPHALTSYTISGFSIHPEHGLGLAEPLTVTSFKDFFVELNLPPSVLVDEILKVEVLVFNYKNEMLTAQLSLKNDNSEFEFVEQIKSGDSCTYNPRQSQSLTVTARNEVSPVHFLIKIKKIGKLELTVTAEATSRNKRDSHEVSGSIQSSHNGMKQSKNFAKLFDLRSKRYDSIYFDMELEDKGVKSFAQTEALVSGDLMGPAPENSKNLVQIPKSTPEQKLFKFLPTALTMFYLKAVNKLTDDLKATGQRTLEAGYQTVLQMKLNDNGYGISSGNVVTTAYVAKFLNHIKYWIEVDDDYIVNALNYLKGKQAGSGKFAQPEEAEKALPSELKSDVVLTAYVAIAFLENKKFVSRFKPQIESALKFIDKELINAEDNSYALAISAYALALGKHPKAETPLNKLIGRAVKLPKVTYWETNNPSTNVEIASYAILAYSALETSLGAAKILSWLQTQRNEFGGFHSTKDTTVGLQALTAMATHFYSENNAMNVDFTYGDDDQVISVRNYKSDGIQNRQITIPTDGGVNVGARGSGIAFVQVWQKFIAKEYHHEDKFEVKWEAPIPKNPNFFLLKVCINFIGQGRQSGQTVAEVSLPSGYEFASSSMTNQIVQTRNDKTIVDLVFNSIPRNGVCVDLRAFRMFNVATTLPYSIKVYEHNNPGAFTLKYYSAPNACVV